MVKEEDSRPLSIFFIPCQPLKRFGAKSFGWALAAASSTVMCMRCIDAIDGIVIARRHIGGILIVSKNADV